VKTTQTFSGGFDDLYNQYAATKNGKELLDSEGISRDCLDIGVLSKNYFTKKLSDMSLDQNANANESISPNNYSSEIVKGLSKINGHYLIWHYAKKMFGIERANELIRAIWDGDIYFHDASRPQVPYCFAYSTSLIMTQGRPYGQLKSLPPKRADSFMAQVIETTMDMSQEWAGAIAPADLLVNYAWYAKREELSKNAILQDCQKFTHVMNNKFRISAESPFTNLSLFDRPNLEKMFEHYHYPDGSSVDYEYVQFVQEVFAEWFSKGDPATGNPYRFPVVTINISCDKNKNILDNNFLEWASKVNLPNGCFNIYVNDGNKTSSCCRLVNDLERMSFRADSFGNGGVNVGSIRVVTANLPRIALRAKGDQEKFFVELNRVLILIKDLLQVHREGLLQKRIDEGFLKFYKPLKWFSLSHMFSTIGVIGIYETNLLMEYDIRSQEGENFTLDVLNHIEDFAKKSSLELKTSFNVEEVPAESVSSKLVQKDRIVFGEDRVPFELYSNQYIPLIEDVSIPERIKTTGKFMEILSGGGILHLNIKERITDVNVMRDLIVYAVKNGVSHLAINYSFGTCKNGHTTVCGNSTKCSICDGKIVEYVTRTVGYFARVSNWGKVRREYEFPRRVFK
jgi:anaerobic ribonucleoside-triphosphate reductase